MQGLYWGTALYVNKGSTRATGKRIIFTGPDGTRDYRARLNDFPRNIGIGPLSPEATGDLNYLCRAAPRTPPPKPKQGYPGGVGWGVGYGIALNSGSLLSNRQIKRAEFRSALEDKITHRYQNPWQAPPCFMDRQQAGARGRLAWNLCDYDNYNQDRNKSFLLSKRHLTQKNKAEEMHLICTDNTFPLIPRASA